MNESSVAFIDNLELEDSPDETITNNLYRGNTQYLVWNWNHLWKSHWISSAKESESSNTQQIHTLKWKNQDLPNKICILKDQMREQNVPLKSVLGEQDSYRNTHWI